MQYDWDWRRAERELQLASAGSPNSNVESQYSFLLVFEGRFAEADLQRMLDLDPFSTATMNNLAVIRNLEGRFVQAREMAQRMAAQYPGMIGPQLMMGGTQIEEGHPELALPLFRAMGGTALSAGASLEAMTLYADRRPKAGSLAPDPSLRGKLFRRRFSMDWFALVYALMGDEPKHHQMVATVGGPARMASTGYRCESGICFDANAPEFRRALSAGMGTSD